MEIVGGVASTVALVEIAGKIGLASAKYITEVKDAKTDAQRILKEAQIFSILLNDVNEKLAGPFGEILAASQTLKNALEESKETLQSLMQKLEQGLSQYSDEGQTSPSKHKRSSFIRKLVKDLKSPALKWPFRRKEVDKIIGNLRELKTTITLALQIDHISFSVSEDQRRRIEQLPIARDAIFGSSADQFESQCLPETRIEVLREIEDWAQSQGKAVFWLCGMAGTGKSTIARTVAQHFADRGQLGASFFFKRSEAERASASKFFPTLAYSLANRKPALIQHISKELEKSPDIANRAFAEQFEKLIFQPLSKIPTDSSTTAIVIDALDECENEQEIPLILDCLVRVNHLKNGGLRIFVTSRPDYVPLKWFNKNRTVGSDSYQDFILHNVKMTAIEHDILVFLNHELGRIQEENNLKQDWPGDDAITKLLRIAVPLFISAATICRFIDDKISPPSERLQTILSSPTSPGDVPELYMIYRTIFQQLLLDRKRSNSTDAAIHDQIRKIIGTIVILQFPLSRQAISDLIGVDQELIKYRLGSLHSILRVPDSPDLPLETFHLSLQNFLLDPNQENQTPFWVNETEMHKRLAIECISLMSQSLMKNICKLKFPGVYRADIKPGVVEQYITPAVGYACQHWVHHLKRGQYELNENDQVYKFLQEHLLHWLEATSLLEVSSKNIYLINDLESLNSTVLYKFSYPQTPIPSISFSPDDSVVALGAKDVNETTALRLVSVDNQSTCLLAQKFFSNIISLAFSPDGSRLASGSNIAKVGIWDMSLEITDSSSSGKHDLLAASPGNTIVSPDGMLFVTCHPNRRLIRMWNMRTGTAKEIITGNTDYGSLRFSPDSKRLAAATYDSIKLWECASGKLIYDWPVTWDGNKGAVTFLRPRLISFSPDGRYISSLSNTQYGGNSPIRHTIWDTSTLESVCGILDSAMTREFSLDGHRLASVLGSHVQLWALPEGDLLAKFDLLYDMTYGKAPLVKFSPDSKRVAGWSDLKQLVEIRDSTSGDFLQNLVTDDFIVSLMAFSPDNKHFAAGSFSNQHIRIWDTTSGDLIKEFQCPLSQLSFSHDGLELDLGYGSISVQDALYNPDFQPETHVLYPSRLTHYGEWLLWKGQRLFWFTDQYRPVKFHAHGTLCMFDCFSSYFGIFEVDEDLLEPLFL
ncbi:Vegetative incompatibility protein [Drechslerella dactyloides]|uniref:Vegetative incompatibility protein n=1 Tax=Drechslerella dactyloides TaxID=74499 RepID=A0AAD6J2Z2_DREDA|nr:Vegetative incompatibility protein [Drechslerella dactyloides]